MSHPHIEGVFKSERASHGRKFQYVGGNRVKKFAFSPYTAKASTIYTFYADIRILSDKGSPSSGVSSSKSGEIKEVNITTSIVQGTFHEFREAVESGEVSEKIEMVTEKYQPCEVVAIGFWRNKGVEVDTGAIT